MMKRWLQLLRVKHYIKNGLILLPLFFSGKLLQSGRLLPVLGGVLVFCLLSSAIYMFNDLRDAERDRAHPTKRLRPVASGAISPRQAAIAAVLLLIAAVGLEVAFFARNLFGWLVLCGYALVNLGYSLGLKNVPVLDIALLVSGFFLRVLYGAAISSIAISDWLYLTVIVMSFYLGFGKRRNELRTQPDGGTRKVLQYYNYAFLDKSMYLFLGLTIAFYSLWCVDPLSAQGGGRPGMVWTVPLVILICLKYSLTVEGQSDGDPVEVLLHDKALLGLIALFAVVMFLMICF